ncbi:hypothetical protein BC830DRAFT_1134125 [Chytriomyces sp. MP71]|nr:hypothetical protein BC830DRAFT_1134125 [Chytriomyces sp. MP71]
MTPLTRDVLKWVQGLDLTYSIKNTKRDLANGFLLAEILSKYHPLEFQMHSYDTGMGPAAKRNNWEQLQKGCHKVGIILSKELVEDVMRSKSEAGALALSILHHHVMKSGSHPLVMVQSNSTMHPPTKVTKQATKASKDTMIECDPSDPLIYQKRGLKQANNNGGGIFMTNAKAASQFLLSIDTADGAVDELKGPTSLSTTTILKDTSGFDDNLGKVALLKSLCTLFGVSDQHLSFGRSCFPALLCKEKLISKFDSITSEDLEKLPGILANKEREFLPILQHSPPTDVQQMIEILLPCIINFGADTKILHVGCILLEYFGGLLQSLSSRDSFSRLIAARELPILLTKVPSSPEKIRFIARILNAFIGPDTPDGEKVRIYLLIKTTVQSAARGNTSMNPVSVTQNAFLSATFYGANGDDSNAFISLLCAVQFEAVIQQQIGKEASNESFSSSQHVTLILSESLTVVNTHRRAAEQGNLFNSNTSVMEVCAALHLLAFLASKEKSGPSNSESIESFADGDRPRSICSTGSIGVLPDGVAGDIIGHERGFLRAVMYPHCPTSLQKAYAAFLTNVLKKIDENHALAPLARNAAGCLLQSSNKEALTTVLILISGCLEMHPPICTPFVKALSVLPEPVRMGLLGLPESPETSWSTSSTDLAHAIAKKYADARDEGVLVNWDVPFISKQILIRPSNNWFAFGVAMGVARAIQTSKCVVMPRAYLQILLAVSAQISFRAELTNTTQRFVTALPRSGPNSRGTETLHPQIPTETSKDAWAHLFGLISDHLMASLAFDDQNEMAANVLECFMRTRGAAISNYLKSIIGALIYLHVSGSRRSRERVTKMVYRWGSAVALPTDSKDASSGAPWPRLLNCWWTLLMGIGLLSRE